MGFRNCGEALGFIVADLDLTVISKARAAIPAWIDEQSLALAAPNKTRATE